MWTLRVPPSAGGFSLAPWVPSLRPIPHVFSERCGFSARMLPATILIDV